MNIRVFSSAQLRKCPYAILLPSHYRDDGTCRCNDPTHTEMKEWGYRWEPRASRWWVGRFNPDRLLDRESPNADRQ